MIRRGATDRVESLRIIRCRLMKALISAGAVAGMLARSSSSSARTCSIAASKRADSSGAWCGGTS